ncbi:acetoacetate decarboxylase, putative (macronuclear) [Tetrahymena thermophila SB210]|uniref:Acetoacetate decarboxylase, putative n=1 Tax=Tetrahymena thermophila (strain SB210) TaxID=312017 RepID=Q22MK2_TETTS|nr:acetoacetate decarboxylase, putative [Tetrahymena thermophila SB210]EAR86346.1 acetoacetate decarboxylase, putative [Tetrahymena thermophila SB210]|eukprot:XP_977018.1 acetoacetate decarboxylase, putative [Tetrahymena thermophila SB210]
MSSTGLHQITEEVHHTTHKSGNYVKGNRKYLDQRLKREEILKLPSQPAISPSFPFGPYRFIDREYLIISYETDIEVLRKVVPYPLVPQSNVVLYEWINMPDSSGFGSYSETGTVIPCLLNGEPVNFTLQMYLNNEAPIASGREIWGFPKKYAKPSMGINKDTLVGRLNYSGEQIAFGTMTYKYKKIPEAEALKSLTKLQCVLKYIPDVDWSPKIAQLIGFNLCDIQLKEAWEGPAKLELIPHVNAPTTLLPVLKVLGGKHIKADITLPFGKVLHDYVESVGGQENAKEIAKGHRGEQGQLDFSIQEDVLRAASMPLIAPSFSKGPLIMDDREYLIFQYESTPEAIARALPEPLIPYDHNYVYLYFINASGSGLGEFHKLDMYVPCYLGNELVMFGVQSYLNSSASRTAGREVFGQPQKFGDAEITVCRDTLKATLKYSDETIAFATMSYKFNKLDPHKAREMLEIPMVNLKFIPSAVEGKVDIAQLTKMEYSDIHVTASYHSPCQVSLVHHVNAPLKDLPVVKTLDGYHIKADTIIKKATVAYDYLLDKSFIQ